MRDEDLSREQLVSELHTLRRRVAELERLTSEQGEAKQMLLESEISFRELFNHSLNGVAIHQIVTDEEGKAVDYIFLAVNPAFEQITGFQASDVLGHPLAQAMPGIQDSPLIDIYNQVALNGEVTRFEQHFAAFNKWYDVTAFSPREGQYAVVFTDVTRRKEIEEELRQREAKYRNLFENVQIGMYRSKIDGSALLEVNNGMVEIFGFASKEEMLSQSPVLRWADQGDRQIVLDRLKETGVLRDYEVQIADKQGRVKTALTSFTLYPEESILEGSVIDISRRKKAEEMLEQRAQELVEANAELQRFNRLAVGREMRMIELKREVNDLAQKLGRPEPYHLAFAEGEEIGYE